jgi:hypothetical protein
MLVGPVEEAQIYYLSNKSGSSAVRILPGLPGRSRHLILPTHRHPSSTLLPHIFRSSSQPVVAG